VPEPTIIQEFELGHCGFVRVSLAQLRGQRYTDLRALEVLQKDELR
jgi:hypothetical protein